MTLTSQENNHVEKQYCVNCVNGGFWGDGTFETICLRDEKTDFNNPVPEIQYDEAAKRAYNSVCDCGKYELLQYCLNCRNGVVCNDDMETVCALDEKIDWMDAGVEKEYYEKATRLSFDAVCNCGKYVFEDDCFHLIYGDGKEGGR
jgi:hypothetical protein